MKLFNRDEIDDELWNELAEKANPSYIHFYSWYLDAISPKWKALILEKNGRYITALPLPWRKKYGIKYVYPPYLAQQLGPIAIDRVDTDQLIQEALQHFSFFEFYFHHGCILPQAVKRRNLILPLNKEYQEIAKAYSGNTRRNLKKSTKSDLLLELNQDFKPIIQLFEENRGRDFPHLMKNDYRYFEKVCEMVSKKGLIEVIHAKNEQNELLAGVIFFRHFDRITFMFSGISPAGKKRHAMFALIDKAIQLHAGKTQVLDFEGSETPGVYEFYKGFGAELQEYFFLRQNNLPWPINLLKR